jgi:hypothetical protein
VLVADGDVVFLRSPYSYLKSPALGGVQLFLQGESGADYGSLTGLNTGIMYVQNAAPAGPVTWLLAETALRPLRWADDGWAAASALGIRRGCLAQEQVCVCVCRGLLGLIHWRHT